MPRGLRHATDAAVTGLLSRLGTAAQRVGPIVLLLCLTCLNVLWAFRDSKLRDFGSFVASGRAVVANRDPYSADEPLVYYVHFDSLGLRSYSPNLNPPISLPLFSVLASVDPSVALNVWRVVSTVFYGISLGLIACYTRRRITARLVLWAVSLAGLWHTIELGQVYTVLLLLATVAWLLLGKRQLIGAGILIGCVVALKPNFGVWPLFLLASGEVAVFSAAVSTAGVLTIIPILLYGPSIYSKWLVASSQFTGLAFPGNSSLAGLFARFGVAQVGMALGLVLVIVTGYLVLRSRPAVLSTSGLALVVSLLASPIAWVGYTLLLLLPILDDRSDSLTTLAAGILAIPFWAVLLIFQASAFWFVAAGWCYGWALIALLVTLTRRLLMSRHRDAHDGPIQRRLAESKHLDQ